MKKLRVLFVLMAIFNLNLEASKNTKLEELEREIEVQKADLIDLQRELNLLDRELKEQEKKSDQIQKEIDAAKKENTIIENDISDLEKQMVGQKKHNEMMVQNLQIINHETNIVSVLFAEDGNSPLSSMYALESLIDEITKDINGSVGVKEKLIQKKKQLEESSLKLEEDLILITKGKDEIELKKSELEQKQDISYEASDNLNRELVRLEEERKIEIELAFSEDAYISDPDKENLMKEAGIDEKDYADVDYIVFKESSWNYTATNPESDAYGLCQSLPAEKMQSAGNDWKTNPVTQLKWCNGYAMERYGTWQDAKIFWIENHWW